MANQQENSDLIIQLPWTVPQQPNIQTIVLQQPAKTHMELNASTDKTAISSFALSVMIALILGGFATWLAYWYGRKSFDLTKQSFDSVIAQIKSSEKIMLETNQNLIKAQNDLMIKTQKIEDIKSLNDKFEKSSIEFIYLAEHFSLFMLHLELTHSDFEFQKKVAAESYQYSLDKNIKEKFKDIYDAFIKLRFNFRSVLEEEDNEKELIHILEKVVSQAILLQNYLIENREFFREEIKKYKQNIADAELMLSIVLKDRSILNIEK